MTGLPEGVSLDGFGNPAWTAEYGRRVEAVMDLVTRHAKLLLWMGLPITGDSAQSQRFRRHQPESSTTPPPNGPTRRVLDTYTMFAGTGGGYDAYLTNADGSRVRVRASDGIHFRAPPAAT
jgi:hypothetical protein